MLLQRTYVSDNNIRGSSRKVANIFARFYPTFGVYRQILIKAPPSNKFSGNPLDGRRADSTDGQTEGHDEVNMRLWQSTGRRQRGLPTTSQVTGPLCPAIRRYSRAAECFQTLLNMSVFTDNTTVQ